MTINEYQAESLRIADGMNYPNGFEAERSLQRQEGDV